MKVYPVNRLYEEMAFLAYYFHWQPDTMLTMDHMSRQRWCRELSQINQNLEQPKPEGTPLLP